MVLRHALVPGHPRIGHRIARAEPQGLSDVSVRFISATDENLAQSDRGVGRGEISIEFQRMLTFGDALSRALGQYLDKSQKHMGGRVVRDQRQGFGQFRFGRREGGDGIGHKGHSALDDVHARRSHERVDIVGVGQQRPIEKAARLHQIVRG